MSVSQSDRPDVEGYYDSIDTVELGDSVQPDVDPLGSYHDDPSTENANGISTLELRAQYVEELRQIDEEIQTLRQVLYAKYRRQQFLKRQLGITMISELREDLNRGVDTIRTSEAFQKTTAAVKNVTEKTSTALYNKWNLLKQTNAFKSFEDKLETAYSSVRLPPSLNTLTLTAPRVVGKLVRSATVTASSSNTSENKETARSEAFVISPNSPVAYDLNDKEDNLISLPSPRGTIQLESLDTNDSTKESSPPGSESFVADAGMSEQKPTGQRRRSRKKE